MKCITQAQSFTFSWKSRWFLSSSQRKRFPIHFASLLQELRDKIDLHIIVFVLSSPIRRSRNNTEKNKKTVVRQFCFQNGIAVES